MGYHSFGRIGEEVLVCSFRFTNCEYLLFNSFGLQKKLTYMKSNAALLMKLYSGGFRNFAHPCVGFGVITAFLHDTLNTFTLKLSNLANRRNTLFKILLLYIRIIFELYIL